MGSDDATLSRRRVLVGGAVVAATAAAGVAVAPAAEANHAVVIKKVVMYRMNRYTYNAKTRVTTVTSATKLTITARFVGSTVYAQNSHGTWARIPYIFSTRRGGLIYDHYLALQLATPTPAAPSAGATIVTPSTFTSVSAYHTTDWAQHLLRRAGYGPTPADLASVRALGYAGWLEQQLNPSKVSDTACDTILARLPAQSTPIWRVKTGIDSGDINSWDQFNTVLKDFTVRALWSKRQLLTVLEDFWGNHFNVTIYADGTAELAGALRLHDPFTHALRQVHRPAHRHLQAPGDAHLPQQP